MEDRLAKQSVPAFGRHGFSSEPSRFGEGDPKAPEGEGCSTFATGSLGHSTSGFEGAGGDQSRPDPLAQSAALTSLLQVSPTQCRSFKEGYLRVLQRALGRVRLQAELASQKGLFFHAVVMQMARRMAPTSSADQPYGVLMSRVSAG